MAPMTAHKKKATDARASVAVPAFRGARRCAEIGAHGSGNLPALGRQRLQRVQPDGRHAAWLLAAALLDVGQRLRRQAHGTTDVNE